MSQQPLDADAVLRDDALLDALGRGELLPEYGDDATAKLLLAWRDDVADTAGLPDMAPAAPVRSIGTARVPEQPVAGRRRFHLSRRMAIAAAFAAFAAGSVGSVAAAGVAEPGSPLWPITKVVYEDRAKSVEAREGALSLLREAREAAERNDPERAQELLNTALAEAGDVSDEADMDKIRAEAAQVQDAIDEPVPPAQVPQPPVPTASPDPVPSTPPSTEPTSPPSPTPGPVEPSPDAPPPSPDPSPTPSSEPTTGMAPDNPEAPGT
jgi:outer membrane biosynthesis protein TonB